MLSQKMTVSFLSIITVLAMGFITPAIAQFDTALSVAATNQSPADVSSADGVQLDMAGEMPSDIALDVTFGRVVTHMDEVGSGPKFGRDDLTIYVYDSLNRAKMHEVNSIRIRPIPNDDNENGKVFRVRINAILKGTQRVFIRVKENSVEDADPLYEPGKAARKNKKAEIWVNYVSKDMGAPMVYSIQRADNPLLPVTSATTQAILLLSEKPKAFTKDHVDATNATWGDPVALVPLPQDADGLDNRMGGGDDRMATGRDTMLYPYVLTLTPKYENKNDIVVKVKSFEDLVLPDPMKYMPPMREVDYMEGMDKLTIKVGKEAPAAKTDGFVVNIPNESRIPKDGYLVLATNIAGSGVADNPENDKDEPKPSARTPAQLLYNLRALGLPNLETFLVNGGTIDVVGPEKVVISEIMWGSDASLAPNNNSQWIELKNMSGKSLLTGDGNYKLIFYGPNETLPAMSTVKDRVGTITAAGEHWSVIGKGQSGRSGVGEDALQLAATVPTQALISMYRAMDATGGVAEGTMASSWMASPPPGINLAPKTVGIRIASPGGVSAPFTVVPPPAPEPATVPVAMADDIMITEIMVDTGNNRLPQWIELTNVSGTEKSLDDWSLVVTNDAADADAIGSRVTLNLSGNVIGVGGGAGHGGTMGKSLLLVAGSARSSANLSGSARVVDITSQVDQTGRYTLISEMAFHLALMPPQLTGVATYGDTAGNLDAAHAWHIPRAEGARSSLIRREMDAAGMATMGTSANGWVLASDTTLTSGPTTWYGSDEDAGTPGYDAGGPLPVELSHFRPARDKATGAVVITWSTQSELNNAGFFIKRSQQKDGEFQVIHTPLIPGAGTTSEKQFYTYTDTTAQPNVVYYYQIEDVSLDGTRQTLTRGTRLKGHIGAAGKATTLWGELKSSRE